MVSASASAVTTAVIAPPVPSQALPASIRAAAAIAVAAIAAADTPPAPPSVPPRGRKLAAWLRSKSGAAPTLMETEAVTVDEGRGYRVESRG